MEAFESGRLQHKLINCTVETGRVPWYFEIALLRAIFDG